MCNISNLITLIISIYWDALCDACQICGKVKESLYNLNDAGTNLEGQRWDCVFTQIFFGISLPFVFFMLDWHLDIWARIGEKHIALEKVVVEQNPQKLYWLKVFLEFYQPRRLEHCFISNCGAKNRLISMLRTLSCWPFYFCLGICEKSFVETILERGSHLRGNLLKKCLLSQCSNDYESIKHQFLIVISDNWEWNRL